MIKPNELRIGNIVEYHGEMLPILGISPHCGDYAVINLGSWIYLKNCEPITLTEEWLLKLGFFKYTINVGGHGTGEESDQWSLNGYNFLFDINNRLFLNGYNWNTQHMQYVHQLQNLYFALTGEELELKEKI